MAAPIFHVISRGPRATNGRRPADSLTEITSILIPDCYCNGYLTCLRYRFKGRARATREICFESKARQKETAARVSRELSRFIIGFLFAEIIFNVNSQANNDKSSRRSTICRDISAVVLKISVLSSRKSRSRAKLERLDSLMNFLVRAANTLGTAKHFSYFPISSTAFLRGAVYI